MKARSRKIIRISIVGIVANIFLAGFKVFVGLLSNSIAVILDAVNNLSDSLSSIVTIIGTRFANKAPDKKHPMGHGRFEYLSTVIIAMLIIYIGFTALIESVKKIIEPTAVEYSVATVVVVSVAIVVKIFLGIYFRRRGKKLESGALIGSGIDALYDAVISAATLVAIIIFFTTGYQIEAYLAAGISLFILRSGLKMMHGAFSMIIGERASAELTRKIKSDIATVEGVNGAFDLIMHDYGHGSTVASVNVEVDHSLSAADIDELSRKVQKVVRDKHHIFVSSVGIYAINLENQDVEKMWRTVSAIRERYDHIIEIHGFRVDFEDKEISFDVVVDFIIVNRRAYYQKFLKEVQDAIPGFNLIVALDDDVSD